MSEAQEQEYETQYFGFPPQTFTDEVYDFMARCTHSGLKMVYKYLKDKYSDVDEAVIQAGTMTISEAIMKSADRTFDKFEVYLLRNIINIPSQVVLPEDRIQQDETIKATNESLLDEEITELQQKIQQEIKEISNCHAKVLELDKQIEENYKLLNVMNQLEHAFGNEGAPLDERITAAVSNARTLLDNLSCLEKIQTSSEDVTQ